MKATAPLLQFATVGAERRGEDCRDFIDWAHAHAEEEKEHYRWYAEDLHALGFAPDEVENGIPDSHILRLIGVQFSLVTLTHPVALLGYFYALECHPLDAASLRALARRLSIPEAALRTLLFHANADEQHRWEIIELVKRYVQRPVCCEAMLASAIEALTGWATLFKDFTEHPDGVK